jgi:hypothetical protein
MLATLGEWNEMMLLKPTSLLAALAGLIDVNALALIS